jgi:hypothetical protein
MISEEGRNDLRIEHSQSPRSPSQLPCIVLGDNGAFFSSKVTTQFLRWGLGRPVKPVLRGTFDVVGSKSCGSLEPSRVTAAALIFVTDKSIIF